MGESQVDSSKPSLERDLTIDRTLSISRIRNFLKLSAFHGGYVFLAAYIRASGAGRSQNVESVHSWPNLPLTYSIDMEMKPSFDWHPRSFYSLRELGQLAHGIAKCHSNSNRLFFGDQSPVFEVLEFEQAA